MTDELVETMARAIWAAKPWPSGQEVELARWVFADNASDLHAMFEGPLNLSAAAGAALAAIEKAGYVVVPREPTPAMIAAAWAVIRERQPQGRVLGPGPGFAEAFRAMVASPNREPASPNLPASD